MSPSLDLSDDGTESSKCASPADMDKSPAEAVFAMVWDMMLWRRRRFRGRAAKAPRWEYNRGHPRCA